LAETHPSRHAGLPLRSRPATGRRFAPGTRVRRHRRRDVHRAESASVCHLGRSQYAPDRL